MLAELSIENFAIIDRLRVRLQPGFTCVTGETGAGKSIVVDALQCALGARTSGNVVRGEAVLAVIEAVFEVDGADGEQIGDVLRENGIELEDTLILRREIQASGRSSARINGRAVPVSLLGTIGALLVDIHGQSDHLSILRGDRQLEVLDRYANHLELRSAAGSAIRAYLELKAQLADLEGTRRQIEQRIDLLQFQVSEIEGAQIVQGEDTELETQRTLLNSAERLSLSASAAYDTLTTGTSTTVDQLHLAARSVADIACVDPSAAEIADRMESARLEIEDISQEIRRYRDNIEFDPRRLTEIGDRLDLMNRLKRKYGPELSDVVSLGESMRLELEAAETLDERVETLAAQVEGARVLAASDARRLSISRQKAAESLSRAAREALQGLGLKNTQFSVDIRQTEDSNGLLLPGDQVAVSFTPLGVDTATFLVSFNPGEPPRALGKVASGGETSRFLLALKSVLSQADRTPTLVFDEVDAGVGGRAGMVVGARLKALSRDHQVLSISHLPQVAALADQHLTVLKSTVENRTTVEVAYLDDEAREVEIAQMMSGTGTEVARLNARELLASVRADRREQAHS